MFTLLPSVGVETVLLTDGLGVKTYVIACTLGRCWMCVAMTCENNSSPVKDGFAVFKRYISCRMASSPANAIVRTDGF